MATEPAFLEPSPVPTGGGPAPSVLASPGYRFLLGSATVAALGGSISSIAVSWLVYHATGSTLDVAYVGLAGFVAGIVFGLFGGVLADRYNRRRLMVTADLVRAVAMGALAATLYLTGFSLPIVLAVTVIVYTFSALFTPASQAILPRIVARQHLEDANGLLSASTSIASTVGAGLGGLVIVVAGPALGLGINALTYLLSAVFLFQITIDLGRPRERAPGETPSIRSEMAEGMRYMRRNPAILEITFAFLPGNFLITLVLGFLVVYAATLFGSSAAPYGIIEATFAGSAAVGALLVGRLRARRFAGLMMGIGVLGQAAGIALLVVSRDLFLAATGTAVMGLCLGLINTTYFATMQAIVPNEVLARVLSIDNVASFVAVPAGFVVGGLLANDYGILFTYAIAGIGLLVNGLVLLALPRVRSLRYAGGDPPSGPAGAASPP